MNFTLTEDQLAFQTLAREFARDEIEPHAAQWDKEETFPEDVLRKAASLGLAAIYAQDTFGGTQLSRIDAAIIFEELATACVSTAAYLSIHNMVTWLIDTYASEDLRRCWLPKLVSMEAFASYCLTEPSSGSDAASLKTTATDAGDHYVLNGTKAFISGGSRSDVYVCMVRTGEPGPRGISCVLVEAGTPGMSFGKKEEKLGWHSQPTTMVFFEDCKIPKTNLIGEVGKGFNIALHALNGGRINIAACSLGGAKASLNHARRYLLEREQFGKPLAQFEALQFKIADMHTHLDAARLMVHRAASSLDNQHPEAALHCAQAKRLATDISFDICNDALQIYGGYGYLQDYPIERFFRDLRVNQILEGTNEIMRVIISRRILSEDFIIE